MIIDIMRAAFVDRTFSPKEASAALSLPRPEATLHRLKLAGLIEPAGRGRYRIAAPDLRLRIARARARMLAARILDAGLPVALDGPDAVRLWTEGRYSVGLPLSPPLLWLAVDSAAKALVEALLESLGVPWGPPEAPPTRCGLSVAARFVDGLRRVRLDDTPVIPRDEVLRLIREEPLAYEGAEEWLRP